MRRGELNCYIRALYWGLGLRTLSRCPVTGNIQNSKTIGRLRDLKQNCGDLWRSKMWEVVLINLLYTWRQPNRCFQTGVGHMLMCTMRRYQCVKCPRFYYTVNKVVAIHLNDMSGDILHFPLAFLSCYCQQVRWKGKESTMHWCTNRFC